MTILILEFFSLKYFETPAAVPPDPAATETTSTLP